MYTDALLCVTYVNLHLRAHVRTLTSDVSWLRTFGVGVLEAEVLRCLLLDSGRVRIGPEPSHMTPHLLKAVLLHLTQACLERRISIDLKGPLFYHQV